MLLLDSIIKFDSLKFFEHKQHKIIPLFILSHIFLLNKRKSTKQSANFILMIMEICYFGLKEVKLMSKYKVWILHLVVAIFKLRTWKEITLKKRSSTNEAGLHYQLTQALYIFLIKSKTKNPLRYLHHLPILRTTLTEKTYSTLMIHKQLFR